MSTLDLLRRLIRQQTTLIGEPVTNLLGTVPGVVTGVAVSQDSQWRVARIAGTRLPTLDEFFTIYTGSSEHATYIADAVAGVVIAGASARRVVGDVVLTAEVATYLLVGTLESTVRQAVTINIEADESGGDFALYLDGTLIRRGYNRLQTTITVDAGQHTLQVLAVAQQFGVSLPETTRVTVNSELLQSPVWSSISTGYLDATTGATSVVLSWFNAPSVGGWRVVRVTRGLLGQISSVGQLSSQSELGLELVGDWTASLQGSGVQLYAGSDSLGPVLRASYDSSLNRTSILVRLTGRSQVSSFWLNRLAYTGQLSELVRIQRDNATPVLQWTDTSVVLGQYYEYQLQAFGLFDPSIFGPLSDVRSIRAGDITPPASIAFIASYPIVLNKRATVKFTTPSDSDYDGVRVYYKQVLTSGTATSGTGTTLSDTTKTWVVNAYQNQLVKITAGTGVGQIRLIASNSVNQLVVNGAWLINPDATSVYQVYQFNKVMTDYGIPSAADELVFTPAADGVYYFCAFDKATNEQDFESALTWTYTAATDDLFLGANQPPVIGLEQLNATDQAALGGIYVDTLNYAVVRVTAADPVDGTTGVTVAYRRRDNAVYVTGLPASASGSVVDNPLGTRGRLLAITRAENTNWLQVKATDATGLDSDVLVFVPDYDNIPEISSIDSRITLDEVVTTIAVDDDTFSFEWWLDGADVGEPTTGTRNKTQFDTRIQKNVIFTFSLADGQRKVLHILPYAGINQTGASGEEYTKEFSRPPRTSVSFDDLDENGVHRADKVKIAFQVSPSVFVVAETHTATGGDVNHLTDSGRAWTVNQYQQVDQQVYFVRIDSGVGAGQCRRIKSNTATQLEVIPSFAVAPTSASVYSVQKGGTQYRLNGTGEFTGVYPDQALFLSRENSSVFIEYFSLVTNAPAEPVHRAVIDADTTPTITTLSVSEYTANRLRITIDGVDDDAKRWKCYARKGANWPTIPGTQTGTPLDETYLRFDLPISQTSFEMSAGTVADNPSSWQVIVVPTNSYGDPGPALSTSVSVVGAGTSDPQLSAFSVLAHDNGSTAYYNQLKWNHNTVITDSSVIHAVKIFAYRDDLGSSTEVELTVATTRRPWQDVGANFTNSDDINESGHNGEGSYLHQVEQRVSSGTAGAVQRRWRYRIQLFESAVLKFTYYLENYDWYIPAPPIFSGGATLTETNGGACSYSGSSYDLVPHENRLTWGFNSGTQNDGDFKVDIYYAPEGAPTYNFVALATGLSTYTTQQYFQDNVIVGPPNTSTKNWTYLVKLIRKSDGAVIDSKQTTTLARSVYATCPLPLPAIQSVTLTAGQGILGNNHRVEIDVQHPHPNHPNAVMDLEKSTDAFTGFTLVGTFPTTIDGVYVIDSGPSNTVYYDRNATCGFTFYYRARLRAAGVADGAYLTSGPVVACSG